MVFFKSFLNRVKFAGISTESGIPDFRSPTGIWTKNQPIEFREFLSSEEIRIEFWKRKFAIDATISKGTVNVSLITKFAVPFSDPDAGGPLVIPIPFTNCE